MSVSKRIITARIARGINQEELARLLKTRQSTVSSWERGTRNPSRKILPKLAEVLKINLVFLEFGEQAQEHWDDTRDSSATRRRRKINLVGEIGAGGHINPIDDHAQGAGLEEVEVPPDAAKNTVAVVVRGNSLYPFLKDGALIYYSTRHKNVTDYLHEMVICHFTDGRKAVKVLTPGSEPNTFTLTSVNAPPLLNEALESVSTIDWMKP